MNRLGRTWKQPLETLLTNPAAPGIFSRLANEAKATGLIKMARGIKARKRGEID